MTTDATRDEAAKALAVLCDKTPRAYPDWDYGRVVAFKEANAKALAVMKITEVYECKAFTEPGKRLL